MKKLKKIISLVLAAVMVLAFGITASAAVVDVENEKEHDYQAYQIFVGTVDSDNKMVITGWGSGVNGNDILTALQGIKDQTDPLYGKFSTCTNDLSVAKVVSEFDTDSPEARAFAKVVSEHLSNTKTPISGTDTTVDLDPGYYLLKDVSEQQEDEEGYVTGLSILQVTNVGKITLDPKNEAPRVLKKVKEDSSTVNDGFGQGYNDIADYDIGQEIPFKLIGTLPTQYDTYTSYKYVFHDTWSEGLSFNEEGTVAVYAYLDGNITNNVDTNKINVTENFTRTHDNSERSLTVSCNNLKTIPDLTLTSKSKIVVEYTALLNENAVIGLNGNTNEVYLEYSNNPNVDGSGDTGKTPPDKVIVFTYELDIEKVDLVGGRTLLKDAEFQLKNSDDKWVVVNEDNKVTGWADEQAAGSTLKTDSSGFCAVIGLDDGQYTLVETKAPTDYKLPENPQTTLTIDATTGFTQNWNFGEKNAASTALTKLLVTVGSSTKDGNLNNGSVSVEIPNSKFSTLPETGGIGTTIFYVVGGILVIGAGILLITKKRMNTKENSK